MKKNLVLLSILATASMMGVACDDNNDSDNYAEGTVRCNISSDGLGFVETWTNNRWTVTSQCKPDQTCSAGRCLSTNTECKDSDLAFCVDPDDPDNADKTGNTVKYCSDGKIKYTNCELLGKQCKSDGTTDAVCVKSEAAASAECKEGETRCSVGGVHQKCNAKGKWANDPCTGSLVCSGGECARPDDACIEGAGKCDGKDAYVCRNYAWEKVESCADGCHLGKCVAADFVPEISSECGSFESACGNGQYLYCSNGIVRGYECGVADYDECITIDGKPECGNRNDYLEQYHLECKYEGQIITGIYTNSCEIGYIAYWECKKADNGKFYAVEGVSYAVCDGNTLNYCKNGREAVQVCSEACVTYEDYMSAQCEVDGKRENPGAKTTCDYFKCDQYGVQGYNGTVGDYCHENYGDNSIGICSNSGFTCVIRSKAGDADCAEGEEAYTVEGQSLCAVVGADESCLTAGGSDDATSACNANGTDCANGYAKSSTVQNTYTLGCGLSQDGEDLDAYCKQMNKDSVCVYDEDNYIDCVLPCASNETDGACVDEDGDSYYLGYSCQSVAGSDDQKYLVMSEIKLCNPVSGSSGGNVGDACDMFDCGNYTFQGSTVAEYCKSEYGADFVGLCNEQNQFSCYERSKENDDQCDAGKKAYFVEDDGYCINVGDDKNCFAGGDSECSEKDPETCVGNVVNYCGYGKIYKLDCDEYSDYYGLDYSCNVVNGIANCYSDEDVCTKEGDERDVCLYDSERGSLVIHFACAKADDGTLLWSQTSYNLCDGGYGYCETATSCGEKREACDVKTPQTCNENGVPLICNPNTKTIVGIPCGNDETCQVLDGEVECYAEEDKCDISKDTVKEVCIPGQYGDEVDYYECVANEAGQGYWKYTDYDDCGFGYGACNAQGVCEYDKCNPNDDDAEKCSGGIAYSCFGYKDTNLDDYAVIEDDCSDYKDPHSCVILDKKATCVSDKDTCDPTTFTTKTVCAIDEFFTALFSENIYATSQQSCVKADNGNAYIVTEELGICANACSSDKTDCDDDGYMF